MRKKRDIDEGLFALFEGKTTENNLHETKIAKKSSRPLSPHDWVQAVGRSERFHATVSKMFGNERIIEEHGGIENFWPFLLAVMIKNRKDFTQELRRKVGVKDIGYPVTVGPVEKTRLTVEIDLTGRMNDILRDVRKAVERYRSVQNVSQIRTRGTKYDPWEIYDLRQSGLSLLEIARKLCGKTPPPGERTPAYNPELGTPYKRVERAYKQAVEMIQTVENTPLILPDLQE